MATLFYIRLVALTTGTILYLSIIALILGHRRPRRFERLLFFLALALLFIYAGGLLEMHARIAYQAAPDATRLLYSVLIAAGLLFLPALLVHTYLEFFEMAAPRTVPWWSKLLVLAPLYIAPAMTFAVPFFARRPQGPPGVRFGPRFGPLDQVAPRFVRFFPWTPEATFLFVAVLLSVAIALGILNLKPKLEGADRLLFWWMVGVSSSLLVLLIATQAYHRYDTAQIEALSCGLITVGLLPGLVFAYFVLRHNFLDFGDSERRKMGQEISATR